LFYLKDGDSRPAAWGVLAAAALGFAVLDKGPVGLALPALVLLADGLIGRNLLRRAGALSAARLAGLFAALAYYAVLARANGWRPRHSLPLPPQHGPLRTRFRSPAALVFLPGPLSPGFPAGEPAPSRGGRRRAPRRAAAPARVPASLDRSGGSSPLLLAL